MSGDISNVPRWDDVSRGAAKGDISFNMSPDIEGNIYIIPSSMLQILFS
jgi:hypothetical protein